MDQPPSRLARRLNTFDATVIGLGAMIGAGIFGAAGPAAQAAGSAVLIGLAIAGILAFLNAMTMAQLATAYPESGGTYTYGRKLIGPFWGFIAGWGFVIGKIASCTAMALTFAYYVAPDLAKPIGITSVLAVTTVNYFGVRKTATATKVLLAITLICLLLVVFSSIASGEMQSSDLDIGSPKGLTGVLEAAGLLFFAFAGYARIATLGEEVVEPRTTIPKAILGALAITFALYLAVVGTALGILGAERLAASKAPLLDVIRSTQLASLSPLVSIGAAVACLGVLLSLLAGISRTAFAMATNHDLPHALSAVHPKHQVPHVAEVLIGAIVCVVLAFADLRTSIGFSSFAILIYYAIANISAWRLAEEHRIWPRWLAIPGALACIALAVSLPWGSIVGGSVLFGVGSIYYVLKKHRG